VSLDDHAIENTPFKEKYFDLVIMINVLDHVQDAFRCLAVATSLVKPGGLLLLGQDLTAEEDDIEDVGHPIRLHLTDILPHLTDFEPVLQKTLPQTEGRNPSVHYATLVFAGRRPEMALVDD
jgi:ubiquinone/menaquinone biosynthesis C-methylase UbiE